ncbi:exocyst complex component EXO70B1-like [Vigna unguiculata]|uniref:Exocyst subunit Exo70 family protein n=1 Tax=Vigna unguiculata TaxID=3917 RepID=A0A4D6M643_VIGUN|nr:exocyst complex component EXO70B1-like [Vigna unguiculata]QCD96772.1 exocyst complex component 7 [Vigna unguiculata]
MENNNNAGDTLNPPGGAAAQANTLSPTRHGQAEEEHKKEEAAASTPPSLEKLAQEIDQFARRLRTDGNANNFEIPDFTERYLDLVEEKIMKYDAGEGKPRWGEVSEEDSWLLNNANRFSKLMTLVTGNYRDHEPEKISGAQVSMMNRISSIHQRLMTYLEEDFRFLMEETRIPTELDPGGYNQNSFDTKGKQHMAAFEQQEVAQEQDGFEQDTNFPGYSEETMAGLSKIASEMLFGGYESECCQVYIISRRSAFEEINQKLGLEKISIDEMVTKMQWETMARDMIPAWINTLKQYAAVYFPGERKLTETVFTNNHAVAVGLFSSLSRGVVIQLLNFAEGAAMTKRAGEKLFKLLDMYEGLYEVIPSVARLFPEESSEEIKTEMNHARSRLGEASIHIFCDLENQIKSETAKSAVPGGAVHPLTRYIMNYLNIAGDYKKTLEQVFMEHTKRDRAGSTSKNAEQKNEETPSPFAKQALRVMDLLDSSLEGKARLYKEVALSNFFMMNNGRYMLQKIKSSSEMSKVMGDNWIRKKSSELRNYHKNYQRETWNRVLQCLSHEGLAVNGKVHKPVLKERFKSFNSLFDDILKTQSSWVVKDEQLQSELRVSISAVIIPAYRSFVARFAQTFDPGRQTEKYIKYQAEDIETYIDELFEGKPHQSIGKRRT